MTRAAVAALLAAALVAGCTPTAEELARGAEEARREGDNAAARALAERGLDLGTGGADLRWTLNRVRLEALAGAGEAGTLMQELDALAPVFPSHVNAELWARLGREALQDDELAACLTILEGGRERFEARAQDFEDIMLELRAKAEDSQDDATRQRLEQIPYLQGR